MAVVRWTGVAAGNVVLAAATLLLAASVTRVFGDNGFDDSDWAVWAVSSLVAALILGTGAAITFWTTENTKDRVVGDITGIVAIAAALAGLVFGWFVPPLTDAATHVRDWLAWKF